MARKTNKPDEKLGSAEDLLKEANSCKDMGQSKRYQAIRLLMIGKSREEVLEILGICERSLREWVKLWNRGGKEGLKKCKSPGRPSKLSEAGKNFLVELIEIPDKRTGKKITAIHLRGVLEKKYRDKIKRWSDSLPIASARLCTDKSETEGDKAG